MSKQAPTKEKKQNKGKWQNPRETVYPEQGEKDSNSGDAYNGDDKHGPLEEEAVEKDRT